MAPSLGQGYSGSLFSTVVEGETSMRCAPKDGSGVGGSQAKVLSLSRFLRFIAWALVENHTRKFGTL